MPQGVKNWDKKPQQVSGPEGPEPHPTPEEAGAGVKGVVKKPQHVKGPEGPDPREFWPPANAVENYDEKPQNVEGPEGPDPTDGTELIKEAQSATVDEDSASAAAPAKKTTATKSTAAKETK
jgi:hypothetical protein